jgi:hypothetical protein
MPKKIDLEREFFRVAKNLETKEETKQQFLQRISELSNDWIDDKFRLGILGLKSKEEKNEQ